ncbi:unnamed protein product, partial [Porites evermanni]
CAPGSATAQTGFGNESHSPNCVRISLQAIRRKSATWIDRTELDLSETNQQRGSTDSIQTTSGIPQIFQNPVKNKKAMKMLFVTLVTLLSITCTSSNKLTQLLKTNDAIDSEVTASAVLLVFDFEHDVCHLCGG